jgi:clan AA aspartic protease
MTGIVNSKLEATICIRIHAAKLAPVELTCVIDTGFSGALTLPGPIIASLDLQWLSIQDAELADGRIVASDVYRGVVEWNGKRLAIEVDEAQTDPLIGMALLEGFELLLQARPGGIVRISPLD